MYCSTCGAIIPKHRRECETCGTPVYSVPFRGPRGALERAINVQPTAWRTIGSCPRCDYHGEGLAYFGWGPNRAKLAVAALLTIPWAFGAGGFVYYGMRREHRVCPRCGRDWGSRGELVGERVAVQPAPEATSGMPQGNDGVRRAWAIMLLVLGTITLIAGLAGLELAPIVVGLGMGGGGFALYRNADRLREERRAAMISNLQMPVLKLAADRGGRLTVTEVAASLGWSLKRAEKILHSLDDGWRVNSEVTDDGVIVYEFREILLGPGEFDRQLGEGA